MAVRQAQLVAPRTVPTTATDLGIVVANREIVRLEAVSGHNAHTSAVELELNVVPTGGSVLNTNLIHSVTLASGESYTVPALVTQRMQTGDTLHATASVADVVTIMVSGTRVTV